MSLLNNVLWLVAKEQEKMMEDWVVGRPVNGINYYEMFIFPMAPPSPLSVSESVVYNW
jgi:hypothetical protein